MQEQQQGQVRADGSSQEVGTARPSEQMPHQDAWAAIREMDDHSRSRIAAAEVALETLLGSVAIQVR